MLKKKNIFILLLFSMVLFAVISSADANEIDAVDDLSSDECNDTILLEDSNEISVVEDDVKIAEETRADAKRLGDSGDDEIIGDSSEKSFIDLDNLINGNSNSDIYLNSNYTYNSSIDSAYYYGIGINRTLTVHGNNFTIKGSGGSKGFNVSASNVVFENINFAYLGYREENRNGFDGGAIRSSNSYNTSARNCTFKNCQGSFGAALYYVDAYDCIFSNGMAMYAGGAMFYGTAKNCTFKDNTCIGITSTGGGGALYGGRALDCTFEGNQASYGGALYEGIAENCTFRDNNAFFDGGAIYILNLGHAINCVFINNHADKNAGAMGSGLANFDVINCTFENNSADYYGGAVNNGIAILCIFKNNTDNTTFGEYFNTTIGRMNIGVPINVTVDYPAQISVPVNLTYGSYVFDNVNIIIKLSKNGENIGNFSCLSGSIWNAELDAGTYAVTFTVDSLYTAKGSSSSNMHVKGIATNISVSNMTVTTGDDGAYLVAALEDIGGNELPGFDITVRFAHNGTEYNLTTDSNGQINMSLKDLIPRDDAYIIFFSFMGNGPYENVQTYTNIYVNKVVTQLDMHDLTIYYGNNASFIAKLRDDKGKSMSGLNLSVSFNGNSSIYTTDENGEISLTIPALAAGTYPIEMGYEGSNLNMATSKSANLIVKQYETQIDASDLRIVNTFTGEFVATLTDEFNNSIGGMELSISFNGQNTTIATNSRGQIRFDIPQLDEGNYTVSMSFAGNEKYHPASKTANVNISKIATNINASDLRVIYGEEGGKLVITFFNETEEPLIGFALTIEFNGENRTSETDENGQVTLDIPQLEEGNYPVTITYNGTEIYSSASNSVSITVTKIYTIIDASDLNIIYGETPSLAITLFNESGDVLSGYDLSISFNGNSVTRNVGEDGKVIFEIPVVPANTYPIDISFAGKDLYNSSSKTVKLTVRKLDTMIQASDISIIYGETPSLIITLYNESGDILPDCELSVTLNGESVTRSTGDDGRAIFEVPVLPAGIYPIDINFAGTELFNASSKSIALTISQLDTDISASDLTVKYGEGQLIAKLTNASGNGLEGLDLYLSLLGTNQSSRTNATGHAVFDIMALADGNVVAGIRFMGTELYKSSSKDVHIINIREDSKLSAENITYVYRENSTMAAKLTDDEGNPIEGEIIHFEFEGLSKDIVTDSEGMAILDLDDTQSIGEHSGRISFGGNCRYSSSLLPFKFTVTKISTTISADNLNTTYGSGDCLIIRLVDYKGNPLANTLITVKMGGLTSEKSTTDDEGIAHFSIMHYPAMEYNVAISFDGDGVYIASTGTAKVMINRASTADYSNSSGGGSSFINSSSSNSSSGGSSSGSAAKHSTRIVTGSFITYYNNGKYIVAGLKDTNNNKMVSGAKVSITLNGKTTTLTTGGNGQIKLTTNGLLPKSYQVKVAFAGNSNYYPSSFTLKVIVKKANPKLVYSSRKTYKKSVKVKKYTVTLKDNKNRVMKKATVTLTVRGKKYVVKTNNKGKATFKITNLKKKGSFGALIKYGGNKYYSAIKKSARIYVK